MTDEQVVNLLKEARNQGKSQQEMIIMLSKRGVTQEQLMRIKMNIVKPGWWELRILLPVKVVCGKKW